MTNEKRRAIISFTAKNSWSYQLIGDNFGVTRCQVAGVLFRHRHKGKLIGKKKNRIGTGPRSGPYAEFTVLNPR